jgi:hypothetical protein
LPTAFNDDGTRRRWRFVIRVERPPPGGATGTDHEYGAPRWEVEAWVTTYTVIAAGERSE